LCCKVRITQHKKMLTTMVTTMISTRG
jgi:hypothetical protein